MDGHTDRWMDGGIDGWAELPEWIHHACFRNIVVNSNYMYMVKMHHLQTRAI